MKNDLHKLMGSDADEKDLDSEDKNVCQVLIRKQAVPQIQDLKVFLLQVLCYEKLTSNLTQFTN